MDTKTAAPMHGTATDLIEKHSIDFIPDAERHGKPSRLFFIWWSSNMQMTTVLTGVIAAALGLSFPWAVVAIAIGLLVGGVIMCLHSWQGARLGLPQLQQSRAQFGLVGASAPAAVAVFMYLGFFATSNLLGGQAIAEAIPAIPLAVGVIVCGAGTVLLAVFGYDEIHRWARLWGYLFLLVFLALTVSLFTRGLVPAKVWTFGPLQAGPFVLMISIAAVWIISYAVYASDYSRYLPRDASESASFWYSYAGAVVSSGWLLAFGALLGVILPKALSATVQVTLNLVGPMAIPMMIVIALGVIFVDALNVYGASLCLLTITEQGRRRLLGTGRQARIGVILGISVVAVIIGIVASASFLTNYSNFLLFLFYLIMPWSAVNLVDFYLIRHGDYQMSWFVDPKGPYGGIAWSALLAYLIGIACEIPFMSTTIYEGPVAKMWNGGDISWIVGLAVAGGLYYVCARAGLVPTAPKDQPTVSPAGAEL
ncbi:MAG TPA: cytosine permease [Candidatus Saccharimonadales bacterium]|nr:cytosine permease [Candidatus Saccharimonadales bacterium]